MVIHQHWQYGYWQYDDESFDDESLMNLEIPSNEGISYNNHGGNSRSQEI